MTNHPAANEIEWVVCRDSRSFLEHRELWQSGWELAFGRQLSESGFQRFFIDTPLGPPIVILGFSDGKVVASSTLVPLALADPATSKSFPYLQYIAAYILPGFSNGFHTYREMLRLVREQPQETDAQFLLSFPNKNAKFLMTRIGGFELVDEGFFVNGEMDSTIAQHFASELSRPFFDDKLLHWRQHEEIVVDDGLVYKSYNGEKNLLDVISELHAKEFVGRMPWWSSWGKSPYPPADDYRMSLCVYADGDIPEIKRSCLLSDVF